MLEWVLSVMAELRWPIMERILVFGGLFHRHAAGPVQNDLERFQSGRAG